MNGRRETKMKKMSQEQIQKIRKRATHVAPSGMGGVFEVEVLAHYCGRSSLKVISPNTEWHGWRYCCATDELRAK